MGTSVGFFKRPPVAREKITRHPHKIDGIGKLIGELIGELIGKLVGKLVGEPVAYARNNLLGKLLGELIGELIGKLVGMLVVGVLVVSELIELVVIGKQLVHR